MQIASIRKVDVSHRTLRFQRRNKDCLKKGTRIPGIYCVSRAVHAHLVLLDLLADKSSENVTLKASAILSGALAIKFY